ncbi:MAG: hypothetical protein M9890_07590 [Thermomicrobiales bacterium]|nr:hypothetical protein [Thermomicrobiales bacterium]
MRTFAIALVVIALGALTAACGTADADSVANAPELPTATIPVSTPASGSPVSSDEYCGYVEHGSSQMQGSPGIQPSLTPSPGNPAFTEADVQAYIDAMQSETPIALKSVEFMPACDVARKVGHSVYRPDTELLALVTVTGEWIPSLPPGVKLEGTPVPGTVAYWIFDATTGNKIGETFGVEIE